MCCLFEFELFDLIFNFNAYLLHSHGRLLGFA